MAIMLDFDDNVEGVLLDHNVQPSGAREAVHAPGCASLIAFRYLRLVFSACRLRTAERKLEISSATPSLLSFKAGQRYIIVQFNEQTVIETLVDELLSGNIRPMP